MSKHTKGPWVFFECERTFRIIGKNGRTVVGIAKQYMDDTELTMSDMLRIVACVNACAGIDNLTLENAAKIPRAKASFDGFMDALNENRKLEQQLTESRKLCGELVKALESVHAGLIEHDWPMPHVDWAEDTWEGKLVSAIAKHKGGGK